MMNDAINVPADAPVPDWSGGLPLRAGDMFLGLYQPSPETTEFWAGVKRRELLLKRCACGQLHHPRRISCPECGATSLHWVPAAGQGEVYTFSDVYRAPGVFAAAVPFTVGIIRLTEGVHVFSRIISEPGTGDVAIGQAVTLDFRVLEQGHLLPVFVRQSS